MVGAFPAWVSGELLEFRALPQGVADGQDLGFSFRALIECRGAGKFGLALPGHPYRRLRLDSSGQPEWDPGPAATSSRVCGARESSWSVERTGDDCTDCRVAISISSKREGRVFLAPADQALAGGSGLEGSGGMSLAPSCLLCVRPEQVCWRAIVASVDDFGDSDECPGERGPAGRGGGLCEAELRRFVEEGYVVLPGAVPPDVSATAKAFINGRLGELAVAGAVGSTASPAEAHDGVHEEEPADPAGEEHVRHPLHKVWGSSSWQLLGLCRCAPVARALEQLVGRDRVDPHFGAQVALRFPGFRDDLVAGGAAVRSSVTGRDWHTDGLRQGKKHPFTLLVGVALSETLRDDQGNLCVWPGSHYFAQASSRWPDARFLRTQGWERTDGALPDLGKPVQLRLRAGDVVLAHCELAHCGGPLLGPDVRYMAYFRLKHRAWRRMREEGRFVDDMWCDLEGLRCTLGSDLTQTPRSLCEAELRALEVEDGSCDGAARLRRARPFG